MTANAYLGFIFLIINYFVKSFALFIVGCGLYYFIGKITSLRDKKYVRSIIAIIPSLLVGVMVNLVPYHNYNVFIFAILLFVYLLLLDKVKSRKIKVVLVLVTLIFLFPKSAGFSGSFGKKGYDCSCLGFKEYISGIDITWNTCNGIPLMCHEQTPYLIPNNVGQ